MLINGTYNPFLQVESRRIRFRLLNGSNARIYYIGFDDNREFHQIATDGGFLETPLQTNRVILAPGERAEILVDFSDGAEVVLKSYPEAGLRRTIISFLWGICTGNLHGESAIVKDRSPGQAGLEWPTQAQRTAQSCWMRPARSSGSPQPPNHTWMSMIS